MDNVLITGGAGFIGSHVAQRLLREGRRLAIVDNLDDYYPAELKRANLEEIKTSGDFQFLPADIRDGEELRRVFATFKPDAVIHLAARPGVRLSFAQPEMYTSINVLGTTQVLEVSRQSGVRRLVFASSSSVYGHSSRAPFREDAVISHPLSIYAATKVAGEAMAFTFAHAYGLSVACLRLFTVYGPRQRPDLAIHKFARLISAGAPIPVFGDGSAARDYTYISDILDGVMACTQKEFGYEIFNLGESQTVRLDRLVELLEAALGKKAVIDRQPPQPGDVPITCADVSKTRAKLGYDPQVRIEQGIPLFVDWFTRNIF